MEYKLEVIGFNIASCIAAQQAGADRIELCDNPFDGGTTPSFGFIQMAREKLTIELYAMIRPRGGDFLYSEHEFEIMTRDVQVCKDLGCDGIVTGMLYIDGAINKRQCAKLVQLAYPMGVTFHRAFDHAANPFEAMEEIIEIGCERILTSGQKPTAAEGINLLDQLIRQGDERIIIMPGSGVRSDNIIQIADKTGATEFHTSARKTVSGGMEYINAAMPPDLAYVVTDEKEIQSIVKQLKNHKRHIHES
jgi:copper homeostasis protein